MRKFLLSFVGLVALSLVACQGNEQKPFTGTPDETGMMVMKLIVDPQGQPVTCASDLNCDGYVDRDTCVYGAACNKGECNVLLFSSCCSFDETLQQVTCPSLKVCASDLDCADEEQCTAEKCNLNVFGGMCTYLPVALGDSTCGKGVCEVSVPRCLSGVTNTAECPVDGDLTKKTTETCDGLDNDCDGVVDNGNPDSGTGCNTGLPGVCSAGTTACTNGEIVCNQNVEFSTETCDGLDNDCDGVVDNGNPGGGMDCNTGLPGVCSAGTTSCENGAIVCNQNVEASTETCDGLDNDCDGEVDEDFTDLGDDCTVGIGACETSGTFVCKADGSGIECYAIPGTPSAEICDGLDNDCDGFINEDLGTTSCGVGVCNHTVDNCVAGLPQICNPLEGKQVETCNGLDDDCNGQTDEEGADGCKTFFYDGDGDEFGTSASKCLCAENGFYSVGKSGDCNDNSASVYPGATEYCNDRDDDCDSLVDEANASDCSLYYYDGDGDEFGTSASKCLCAENGFYSADKSGDCNDNVASIYLGATEYCNSLDDDCDGQTDEDFKTLGASCSVGVGECTKTGVYVCNGDGSGTTCNVTAGQPSTEICDGKDNDCDGDTDEANASDCSLYYYDGDGDEFGTSASKCLCAENGFYSADKSGDCNDNVASIYLGATEYCNSLDDDCDGQTDEGDACSSCNTALTGVMCGQTYGPFTNPARSWLNGYSCKNTLNESGGEKVLTFMSGMAGVTVTAKPVNVSPSTANLDVFLLLGGCNPASCVAFGYSAAAYTIQDETEALYIVVDGFAGASATFDVQITCKEMDCGDGQDNDQDGKIDCNDTDCATNVLCQTVQENCTNGLDDDGDGLVDCSDPDCRLATACLGTCTTQETLSCGGAVTGTTNSGSNMNSGYSCAAQDESGPERIYRFTPSLSGTGQAVLSGLSADLDVFVLSGECRANTCLSWGNNAANFTFTAGQTYYLVVDGFAGATGSYTLSLSCNTPQ